jgi:hypothetical protein
MYLTAQYKTTKGQLEIEMFFKQYDQPLKALFSVYSDVVGIKNILLNKLNKLNMLVALKQVSQDVYDVSSQEGFVAVDSKNSTVVKLVDRLDFSFQNFQNHK